MKTSGPHPQVSRLLNHAQEEAANDLGLVPANERNLERLGALIRDNIYLQVQAGMWKRLGIDDPDALAPMTIRARLGNQLIGEPKIKIDYSFTGTPLAHLIVEATVRVSDGTAKA